jgi:phosphoenolpyruvate phosphomutase
MQNTCATIYKEQSLGSIEPNVASVKEVFRLQNQPELDSAEKVYLPQNKKH